MKALLRRSEFAADPQFVDADKSVIGDLHILQTLSWFGSKKFGLDSS